MSANSPKIGEIRKGKEINRSGSDNHKYIWHRCEGCGKARWVQLMNIKSIPIPNKKLCIACGVREAWKRPEVIIKQSESRKGEKCYCWKGGLARSRHRGYVFIKLRPDSSFYSMANQDKKISGAYVAQHRLVMARYLGRCLKPDEIVHHKNSIRDDNRIENLELTKPGAHTIEHGKGYRAGYALGFRDGRSKKIQRLRQRINELEQLNLFPLKEHLSDWNSDERKMKEQVQAATGIPTIRGIL